MNDVIYNPNYANTDLPSINSKIFNIEPINFNLSSNNNNYNDDIVDLYNRTNNKLKDYNSLMHNVIQAINYYDNPITTNNTAIDTTSSTIDKSNNFNTKMHEYTQQFSGTPYLFGGKSLFNKKGIDCSGWVYSALSNAGIKSINGSSEDIVNLAIKNGKEISQDDIINNPVPGMVIGVSSNKSFAANRPFKTSHVAVTYSHPKTGKLMISESAGGSAKGVRSIPYSDWIKERLERRDGNFRLRAGLINI